jgi:predicted enzyme related to lactoylglutathione lyase
VLGLSVEFETESNKTVGLKDEGGFNLILVEMPGPISDVHLYFQVDDVEQTYRELVEQGVSFLHPPQVTDWGYGASLEDPDGRVIGLWDEATMVAQGTLS